MFARTPYHLVTTSIYFNNDRHFKDTQLELPVLS